MSIISLQNISKKYGNKIVFDNLNLNIEKGEYVSIIGRSGSGKSTLLNMIGLLEKPSSGIIKIKDNINPKLNSKVGIRLLRNEISYLFQNYGLIENKTVKENLKIATHFLKLNKEEEEELIKDVLIQVGLKNISMKEKIYSLSGGEQQRIAIAKVLIKPSEIVLADEPTGSLDNENATFVIKLLREMQKKGKTIIIVTHDNELTKYSHRVIQIGN